MSEEDEERVFTIVATKTLTATFEVYAEDEEDAKDLVEGATFDYGVTVSDAQHLDDEDWNVLDVTEQ